MFPDSSFWHFHTKVITYILEASDVAEMDNIPSIPRFQNLWVINIFERHCFLRPSFQMRQHLMVSSCQSVSQSDSRSGILFQIFSLYSSTVSTVSTISTISTPHHLNNINNLNSLYSLHSFCSFHSLFSNLDNLNSLNNSHSLHSLYTSKTSASSGRLSSIFLKISSFVTLKKTLIAAFVQFML